jgi:hypothetical protein
MRPSTNALAGAFLIVNFSPRVGVQWTYGTAPTIAFIPGAARPPLAVIHAMAGVFQNVGSANLLSDAVAQTGLPTSTRTIACVVPRFRSIACASGYCE